MSLGNAAVQTVICENPINFECRDGLVYISDPAVGFLRAIRFNTFYASFHNAAKCMQQCHERVEAEVIPFPRPEGVTAS
jgi:hypothetical protein